MRLVPLPVAAFAVGLLTSLTIAQAPREPKPLPPSAKFVEVPAVSDEPLAKAFSAERAARSLDAGAINFSQTHRCFQCHANPMYLLARPALEGALKSPSDMRVFYEWIVEARRPKTGVIYDPLGAAHPAIKGDGKTLPATEPILVALGLAFHDRATTGKLHPTTRKALDAVLARQRLDGGFNAVHDGVGWMMAEFDQTVFAGLAVATAPDKFAKTDKGMASLAGVRKFLASTKNPTPYQQGMLLWASDTVGDLLTGDQRKAFIESLTKQQRPDGGWCLAGIQSDKLEVNRPSDGYGTGFAVFVLRGGGVKVDHPAIQSGVKWLKANQRESGRWFTPTLVNRPDNLRSNSGSAFAVLALVACGEIPAR